MTQLGPSRRAFWLVLSAFAIVFALALYYFRLERSPQAHIERSTALRSEGRDQQAEAEIREAIRLQPSDAEAREILGSFLESDGDTSGAVAAYQQAVLLKPDYAEARYNLAGESFASGDTAAAKAQYKSLITPSTPNGVDAFLQSELPFQGMPTEILMHVSTPGENPIVLNIVTQPGGTFLFAINSDSTPSEMLGPHLRDIFTTRERVVWVRFADGLPPFARFMQVMETLKDAGTDRVNLILVPKQ